MLKKLVAIVCVLVLAIQVLPMRQIGNLLSGGQLTEEIAGHNGDVGKDADPIKGGAGSEFCLPSTGSLAAVSISILPQYLDYSQRLQPAHSGEVPTPPPDCTGCPHA